VPYHLALQVGVVDHIEIDDAEAAHPGGGQIEQQRRAQPACAHTKHRGGLEPLLALHADLGQDQVAAVAGDLIGAELDAAGVGRKHGRWDQLSILHGRRWGGAGGWQIHHPTSSWP